MTREDITVNKVFSIAFITGLITLFSSRLFYVLFNWSSNFSSLIGFFAINYFPGLSLVGALIGGLIFLVFYCNVKKMPKGKIIDLFIRSFIGVLPIGFILIYISYLGKTSLIFNIMLIVSIIIALVFIKPLYKLSEKGEIKDGSFAMIFISVYFFIYFIAKLFVDINKFNFFNPENIILFVSIFASLILLINQEVMEKILEKK
jgi:prolipoprotein diacylglyceryltransferase